MSEMNRAALHSPYAAQSLRRLVQWGEQDFTVTQDPAEWDERGLEHGHVPLRITRIFNPALRLFEGLRSRGFSDMSSGLGATLRLRPPRIPDPNRYKIRMNMTNPQSTSRVTIPGVFVGAGQKDRLY